MKKRLLALLLAALTALSLTACGAEEQPVTSQIFAMDTVMDFAVYGENAQAALTAASQEINALEQRLSRTRAGSEISTLNETGSAELSDETVQLLQSALALSDETGGAFDITIAPLVTAWGITSDTPRVPSQEEIASLLPLVGSEHVRIDGNRVTLDAGCSVDLGGIAKGYASDRVAQIFREQGVTGTASLGGNVYVSGRKSDGSAWRVAVRDPQNTDDYAAVLALEDVFAITSGGYQRNFTGPDGTVYQHILDPKTGCPVQSDLLSVTIVSDSGTLADACSTALYVMGEQEAVNFWRQTGGFEMVLITADGRLLYTPGLAEKITTPEEGRYAAAAIDA